MEKRRVNIRLLNRDYTLVTDRTQAHVEQIVRYVDRKMRDLSLASRSSDEVVSVLTSITLAEELFSAKEENRLLRFELQKLRKRDSAEADGNKPKE